MRIVIVHGRAAEMEIPSVMAAEWTAALWWGQQRLGSPLVPGSLDVRLAFYGDLWRPDQHQPLPVIHPAVVEEGIGFSDISMFFDRLGVGDALLEHLLHDVDDYYSVTGLRDETNRRLVTAITTDPDPEGTIVVGFSMGSLVAYHTLRTTPALAVDALITIGSPLAMPSFHRRLAALGPTPFPSQLRLWVNVWTKDDPGTAGHVDVRARFPSADHERWVQDIETWGRGPSPANPAAAHNALDYLSSRVFAKALRHAVETVRAG